MLARVCRALAWAVQRWGRFAGEKKVRAYRCPECSGTYPNHRQWCPLLMVPRGPRE
jgi:hypothetical protein